MSNQNKIIWVEILRRRGTLLYSYLVHKGESLRENVRKALGIDFSIPNAKQVVTRIIIDASSAEKFRTLIFKELDRNPNYFDQYAINCLAYCKRLLFLAEEVSKKDVNGFSNGEIKLIYQEYVDRTLELIPFLNSFVLLNDILTEMIREGFEKERASKIFLEEVIIPAEINFVAQEIESILKIASKVNKKPELKRAVLSGNRRQTKEILDREAKVKILIEDHVAKFGWLTTQAYVGDFMKSGDVVDRLQNLLLEDPKKKLTDAKQRKQKAKRKFNELLRNPKVSIETRRLLKIASQYLYLRFYRIDVFWIAHYKVVDLYQEMAKRLGIEYDEILYLTPEEILASLEKTELVVSKGEIKKRRSNYALVTIDGRTRIYSGDEVDRLLEEERKKEKVLGEEIKGAVACKGKARGQVRIVMDPKVMGRMKRGDILVTNMTTPDLMQAIEKSAAIVTDEGGILCHAAIVSRELGIPCVIGTERATTIFKDGDLIEVDAERGVVRKLEK